MADLAILNHDQLQAVQNDTYDRWNEGLTRQAYDRYYTAQTQTPWGRSHLVRLGLIDHDEVVASAKRYAFDATLDGRAIRVAGLGAVFSAGGVNTRRGFTGRLTANTLGNGTGSGVWISGAGI